VFFCITFVIKISLGTKLTKSMLGS